MKREILFKAKRVDNGEWVEGLPCYLTEYAKDFHEVDGIQCDKTREYYDVNPETVCQFTGILDKNGNKIFEGDKVVSCKKFYSKNEAVVMWLEKRCGFYFIANTVGTDIVNRNPFQSAFKMNSIKVEITGNIHDK